MNRAWAQIAFRSASSATHPVPTFRAAASSASSIAFRAAEDQVVTVPEWGAAFLIQVPLLPLLMMAVGRRKRLAWQLMSLLLAASVTLGALAAPVVDSTSSGQTQRTSLTISHTTGAGANRLMLVGVTINNKNSETVSSITYNAAALTLVGTAASTTNTRVEIWRLIAPTTGTYNVVITFSAYVTNGAKAGVATFTGVHQTTPLGTFASANANSVGPATVNVTSAASELVFDTVGCEGNDTATLCSSLAAGAGQTQRWNLTGLESGDANDQSRGAGSTEPGAASVTMSWTLAPAAAAPWAIGAVSIKPAVPPINFQAAGTAQSATGALTGATAVAWPTHQANDIGLLIIETSNQAVTLGTNAADWTPVADSPQGIGTAAGASGARLTVFWSRATSSSMGAVGVNDSGDHQFAQIITFRGVVTSGNPWDVTSGGTELGPDTSISITGDTTTVNDCLVVLVAATSLPDSATTTEFGAMTNANLASLTELVDRTVTAGNGGGLFAGTGTKASFGTYAATTFTAVTSAAHAFMSIALKPEAGSAPVVVDAVSSGDTRPARLTISHTTGAGADRLMLVGISFDNDELETVSSVTYNGVALTLVGTAASSDDARVEIWRLIAPPTGTFDVVINFSAPLRRAAVAGVMTFTDVHQTTPLGTFASNSSQTQLLTDPPTVNVTSAVNELVFDTVACEACTSFTVGGGQTQRWNLFEASGAAPVGGAGSTEPGAATVTMSWTQGTGDYWAIGGVSIKPAPAPGDFNAYETGTGAGANVGVIKTQIAGATISHDIIRLNAARTAIDTAFTGTVTVDVLNSSNNTAALDSNGCRSSWTVIQTFSTSFVAGDLGRKTISFTQANSYPNVRLRITYATGPKIGCSNDNFAIRPNTLASFAVTDTDWETAGTGRALNDVTFGTVTHKAGRPLSGRATALNAAGTPATTTNYVGAPTATLTACVGAACTATFGALTLGTTFVAGQLVSDVASYDNVGSFALQLVDSTFASVDAADGSTTAERNITSAVINVGRFVPDHFAVALNTPVFGTACGSFTYIGQAFNYVIAPVITVTAQGFANNTTTLYATSGSWWRITNASLTGKAYTAAAGTLNTSGITGTDPVIDSTIPGAGVGTLTFSSGTGLLFTRTTPTAPASPFNADVSLAINVIDADGVSYASNPAQFGTATAGNGIAFNNGKPMRFGRLALGNALGSEVLNLPIPIQTQYWNGTSFVTNTLDSCTTITASNIALSNYQGALNSGNLGSGNISISGAFNAGVGNLKLTKPSSAVNGSVDLCVDLDTGAGGDTACLATTPAGKTYLQGIWSGANYDRDPSARASFGFSKGSNSGSGSVIYQRENY